MAAQTVQAGDDLAVPVDYVPGVRGFAVLVVGPDGDGDEALAIWRLGATGHAVGAWIFRLGQVEANLGRLLNVLALLRDRCVVDWDADRPDAALRRIEPWLPADQVPAFRSNRLFLPDLLSQVREHRKTCAEAVERHRLNTKSALVPLSWGVDLPEDPAGARRVLAPSPVAAVPVAAEALSLVGSVRRAVELWQDTEQTRYRRTYLRSLGEVRPLPSNWLAALRAAADGTAAGEDA